MQDKKAKNLLNTKKKTISRGKISFPRIRIPLQIFSPKHWGDKGGTTSPPFKVKTHQPTPLESYQSSPDVFWRLSKA